MVDDSVFVPGKVIYNSFRISFIKPFDQQTEALTEDLIQVEYDHGFIIDIGWYPELDPKGNIVVQLIKDKRWDQPIERTTVTDLNEMYDVIKHMIIMIGTESRN